MKRLIGDRAFYKKLMQVMTPILIQNVITNFVSLLDNIMVGQVGTEPMSGVAIVNQLLFVFNLCIFGGLAGAGIFTAQYYGRGDNDGVRDSFRAKLYIALGAVVVFAAAFFLWGDSLIQLFLHKGEEELDLAATLGFGKEYLNVMFLQFIPFALMQVYSSTLRETGETVLPMKAGITAVFVNLVFNYILIYGKFGAPKLGVVGAAIATVLSRFVECFIVVYWTHRHSARNPFIVGAFKSLKVPKPLAKKVWVLGMPLLINEVGWSSGMAMLNQCYSMRGLEVVSAVNISTTVSNLFFCAFFAMGAAISIIVGQLLGSGELEKAVDEDRKLIAFSVALCAVVGILMICLAPLIPRIYNTTELVKNLASSLLIVSAVMMPLNAFTNSCYFTLRSGGLTGVTFVFDSGYLWVVCVPIAFVLSRYTALPILPLFIAIQALELIKATLGFFLVRGGKWVNNLVEKL